MNERSFIVNNLLAHMCDFLIPPSGAARSLFQRRAAAVATALRAVPCGSMLRPATRLRVAATACQGGRWLQERPHAFSRFRVQCCFHGVLRHHRHRLHWRDQAFIRKRGRLPDELPDRGDRAHNAHRVNYRFHYAPAFLFRADQEPIDRLSFLLHNFKTPRSSRFV